MVEVAGGEGEAGVGSEGGILMGVMLTVRRTTRDRGEPAACWAFGCVCAVETTVEVEVGDVW